MKSTAMIPLVAVLMLSTAASAQTPTAPPTTEPAPPAATEPATPAPAPSDSPTAAPESPSAMPTTPGQSPSSTADAGAPVLTDDQAKALKNRAIWSSDQKNVGEVADVVRDNDGRVTELHADVGGFLGFGQTRVRVGADEFRMVNDRIELTRTQEQINNLPKVTEN